MVKKPTISKFSFLPLIIFLIILGGFLFLAPVKQMTVKSGQEKESPVAKEETNENFQTESPQSLLPDQSEIELEELNDEDDEESIDDKKEKAIAVRVIDGDTFETANGVNVRLVGIDTPEKDRPYYNEAKQRLADLILKREVRMEKDVSETDKYGRFLRFVYLGDTFVNLEMVKSGFAYAYPFPPDVKYESLFRDAEIEARNNKRGLWR